MSVASEELIEVRTAGVGSPVFDGDRELLGHVVMLDCDETTREEAVSEAERLDGPAVVVRSSERSHHVYGLAVGTWGNARATMRSSPRCSREFIDEMIERSRCTLRTHAKYSYDGDVVVDEPVPVAVVDGDASSTSRPHAIRLRDLARERGEPEVAEQLVASVAGTLVGETYSAARWSYEVSR